MTPERRDELNFLLRIKHPIYVVGGEQHRPDSKFITKKLQGDIFTLVELVAEDIFSIQRFDPPSGMLSLVASVDICVCNGYTMSLVVSNDTIEICLDYDSVAEFIDFYNEIHETRDE